MDKQWNQLDVSLLSRIKQRLGAEFEDFATVCARIGLLRNNFLNVNQQFAASDLDFAAAMCVSSIVSAANHYGSQADLVMAKKLANWAITLEPKHPPALLCLIAISQVEGDQAAMKRYSDRFESVKREILSKPPAQRSAMEQGFADALQASG